MIDECRDSLLLLLLVVGVQIRVTGLAGEVFTIGRGQLYRRRQKMSSFFVHKKHASKHEIVTHRCHVIIVMLFGREPNVLRGRRSTLLGRLDGRPVRFERYQRARVVVDGR